MAKLNSSGFNKRWSLDRHDVSMEIMEDLGVSAIEDDSSSAGSHSSLLLEDMSVPSKPTTTITAAVKRKEIPSPIPQLPMEYSEDDQSSDSFLLSKRMRMDGPPSGSSPFSKLPDEVILSIFRWLPKSTVARCAQVSKRWKRLSYDESLWRRLDLSGTCLKPSILGNVLLRGTQILRLAKSEVKKISNHLKYYSKV